MKAIEPAALIRRYKRGHVTAVELRIRLVQAAASRPPENFVALIPAEQLEAIRELAAAPPSSLEQSPRIFTMATWVGSHDYAAEERQERQLWYDGIWRWHRFFNCDEERGGEKGRESN